MSKRRFTIQAALFILFALSFTAARPVSATAPELKGWVDLHTHPMSYLGFGGKLIYGGVDVGSSLPTCSTRDGAATDRSSAGFELPVAQSEEDALGYEDAVHGGAGVHNPCGDTLRNKVLHGFLQKLGGANFPDATFKTSGPANFETWPVWNDLVNQHMWVDWIRRAHAGGLRVMVALAVNNRLLGDAIAGSGDLPTDDKSVTDIQVTALKNFVARHPDFMQIASHSSDVQTIVAQGKLAVIIGTEIDQMGNLGLDATAQQLIAEVDRLYDSGVRYIFPVHLVDNGIGGTAAYESLFNIANKYANNDESWSLACAPDVTWKYHDPLSFELRAVIFAKLGKFISSPAELDCPSGQGNKNTRGLTSAGRAALQEMMNKGMLIDIDHMSEVSADQAIALAQNYCPSLHGDPEGVACPVATRPYPLNSGHNGIRGAPLPNHTAGQTSERSFTVRQYQALGRLHGMAGVGSANLSAEKWVALLVQVTRAMGTGAVVGIGTDMDGMEFAMPRREKNSDGSPALALSYPIKSTFGTLPASSQDNKTWDYNKTGVAHYGMLPDFLADAVQSTPDAREALDKMMTGGAQYFYETWRRAETGTAERLRTRE